MRIFLSYSHRNMSFADQIEGLLKEAKVEYFRDIHDLKAGDRLSALSDHISNSSLFFAIIGKGTKNSYWQSHEIDVAFSVEKRLGRNFIIPIVGDDLEDDSILTKFGTRIYISQDNLRQGIYKLIFDIESNFVEKNIDKRSSNIVHELSKLSPMLHSKNRNVFLYALKRGVLLFFILLWTVRKTNHPKEKIDIDGAEEILEIFGKFIGDLCSSSHREDASFWVVFMLICADQERGEMPFFDSLCKLLELGLQENKFCEFAAINFFGCYGLKANIPIKNEVIIGSFNDVRNKAVIKHTHFRPDKHIYELLLAEKIDNLFFSHDAMLYTYFSRKMDLAWNKAKDRSVDLPGGSYDLAASLVWFELSQTDNLRDDVEEISPEMEWLFLECLKIYVIENAFHTVEFLVSEQELRSSPWGMAVEVLLEMRDEIYDLCLNPVLSAAKNKNPD